MRGAAVLNVSPRKVEEEDDEAEPLVAVKLVAEFNELHAI
jgi:hypothetical protein